MTRPQSLGGGLVGPVGLVLAAVACQGRSPEPEATPGPASPAAAPQVVNILWFGHSLVQRPGTPPVDLPQLVRTLQQAARADGRSTVPDGISQAYIRQGQHLGDHLADDPTAKLAAHKNQDITHVIGIGFMHMLGQKSFDRPTVSAWLGRVLPSRYDSPRPHTEHIYRFMGLVRQELPSATWVNYIGPALATNTDAQSSIDARYACIATAARGTGAKILNAPVGRAFRNAEKAARAHPEYKIVLQEPDGLHLTPQGALLAATVLHAAIYVVDPRGLTIPDAVAVHLGTTADVRTKVVGFLQEVARATVTAPPPGCDKSARLPEDDNLDTFMSRR